MKDKAKCSENIESNTKDILSLIIKCDSLLLEKKYEEMIKLLKEALNYSSIHSDIIKFQINFKLGAACFESV